MSLADEVKAAFKAPPPEEHAQFRKLLDEFVTALGELGIGARLDPSIDPRRLNLTVYPLYRPGRGSSILTFVFGPGSIVIPGDPHREFRAPDAFSAALVDFVRLESFKESVAILREEATRPVEGRLFVKANRTLSKGDVMVEVAAADQERLFKALPDSQETLEVARIDFPGNATFAEPPKYELLESAGLLLASLTATRTADRLVLSGTRLKVRYDG